MRRTAGLTLIAALALAGCGSSSPASSGAANGPPANTTPTTEAASGAACSADVTVANLAVTGGAAMVLGVSKGLFTQNGLKVTLKDTAAASTQAAVVSGDAQFGYTNVPAVLAASSNGLPVRVVAAANAFPPKGMENSIVVMAKGDSGIKTVADLAGKKVAVDTLFQLPHLSLIQAAQAAGVDPKSFTVAEIPFPAMIAAVERGQVDAADLTEPFRTLAKKKGFVEVVPNNDGVADGAVQGVWVTSADYATKNPDVVACFQKSVAAANTYATAHEDELRAITPTFTKTPPALASVILFPSFDTTVDTASFESYAKTMKDNGVLKKDVNLGELIVAQP